MTFTKTLALGTFLASTLLAGSAFAKGHDQGRGNDTKPGNEAYTDVGDTVEGAQSLGAALGERPEGKGPMNDAADNAGGPSDRE